MLVARHGIEELADLLPAQDERQSDLSFRRRDDRLDRPVLLEGHLVEKPERGDRHEERARRQLPLGGEMELIRADLLGTQVLRGPAEMTGELRDVLHVRGLGLLGEIPDLHVLDHPLT